MSIAVAFIRASSSAPNSPRVRSLSTRWIDRTSELDNSSALVAFPTPTESAHP